MLLLLVGAITGAALHAPGVATADCVNASSGEPEDCSAPGAVDENVFSGAGPTGSEAADEPASSDGDGGSGVVVAIGLGAIAVLVLTAFLVVRRRRVVPETVLASGSGIATAYSNPQTPSALPDRTAERSQPDPVANHPAEPVATSEATPEKAREHEQEVLPPITRPEVAPGWYPDPTQPVTVRYWDGWSWTDQRAPTPAGYVAPGSAVEESKGWRIATLIISLVLSLGLLIQSCAVMAGGSLAESFSTGADQKQEAEDLAGAGATGVFVALFWLIGAGFVLGKPKVSIWLFGIAVPFCLIGGANGFSDLYIWAIASALFAMGSWAGVREQNRARV